MVGWAVLARSVGYGSSGAATDGRLPDLVSRVATRRAATGLPSAPARLRGLRAGDDLSAAISSPLIPLSGDASPPGLPVYFLPWSEEWLRKFAGQPAAVPDTTERSEV